MTQKEHDELLRFTYKVCRKVYKHFSFDAQEIFYEAFARGETDIKKAIANEVYNSFFKELSIWVNKQKPTYLDKKCNNCNKIKEVSQFNKIFSKKYNFYFYRSECKDCLSKKLKEKKEAGLIDYKSLYKYKQKYLLKQENRDKVNARRLENRRLCKEWWTSLNDFTQKKLLEKYNLTKPSRDCKMFIWAKEKK